MLELTVPWPCAAHWKSTNSTFLARTSMEEEHIHLSLEHKKYGNAAGMLPKLSGSEEKHIRIIGYHRLETNYCE
jgi:hypothetical protein